MVKPSEKKNYLKQFHNCQILRDGKIIREDLWVRNGRFVNPEKIFYDEKITPDIKIDCDNALISPGYIDLQINGERFIPSSRQRRRDNIHHTVVQKNRWIRGGLFARCRLS